MKNYLIEYVWDKKRGQQNRKRLGTMVGLKCEETGEVVFGWSKYAAVLECIPFDRSKGLEIAQGRANCERNLYYVEDLPYDMQKNAEKFIDRCKRYFKVDRVANFVDVE